MKPIADTITLHHRTKLLTRRVRAAMRVFNKNHNYFSETPNITWDDSFIPPKLYGDLETEQDSLDTREGQQIQKEKASENQSLKMEEQMAKEKANTMQNDKGKEKETAQYKENSDETEKSERKRTRKSSESSLFDISDSEEGTSSDESEPLAKRVKCNESIDNVGFIPIPPPCRRCTISQMECKHNGWHAACKNCRKARQTCSLSKALPNDIEKANETTENNKKPVDTEKLKTQRFREIHSSVYTLTKSSILDDKSLTEDEDAVDQLDEVPANKPSPKKSKVSTMTTDGLIPNDPKVCLLNPSFSHVGNFDWTSANVAKSSTRSASVEKPRITVQDAHNVTSQRKGASTCRKVSRRSTLSPIIRRYVFEFILLHVGKFDCKQCDNCQLSHKECVRRETQDPGTACRQCAKDKKGCSLSKGLSKIKFIPNDPIVRLWFLHFFMLEGLTVDQV